MMNREDWDRMYKLGWLVALLAMTAGMPLAADTSNLLPNAGFEAGPAAAAPPWTLKFWQPAGQPQSTGAVSNAVAHSGKRSLYTAGTGAESHAYWSCSGIRATAGERYVLSAWVRPHGVLPPASRCQIHLGFQNDKGEIIQDKNHPFYTGWALTTLTGYSDWVPLGVATVAPPGTATLAVTLRFVGIGECWFDDVRLVRSATEPVPATLPDLCRDAGAAMPDIAAGETAFSLKLKNPFAAAVSDLHFETMPQSFRITGASPAEMSIAPHDTRTIPLRIVFPANMNECNTRILITGRYRLGREERSSSWLLRFNVMSADLLVAVQEGRWGLTPTPAPASAQPLEILGTVLTRAAAGRSQTRYVDSGTPLDIHGSDSSLAVVVRVNNHETSGPQRLAWECLDYFFRPASGSVTVDVPNGRSFLTRLQLPAEEVRRIYETGRDAGAARFRVLVRLLNADFRVRGAKQTAATQSDLPLKPDLPPEPKLPPLDTTRQIRELPVFGKLRLVDEVICGDPHDPHLLHQGGKGLQTKYSSEPLDYYGGSDRLTYDWFLTYRDHRDAFTHIATIFGKPCRVADNWGWFAYLMGRGAVQPGKHYVLDVEFPEDTSRNFLIWDGIDSRASIGFHTGGALGDPFTKQRFMEQTVLPLSGTYEHHYTLLTAQAAEGWIDIHSMGERAAPFSHGIAVHAIRLYELGDDAALDRLALQVHEPEGLPRRLIGFISEDVTPSAAYLAGYRFYGFNFYAPLTLSYCGGTYATNSGWVDWPSRLFGPDGLRNPYALAKPPYYHVRNGATAAVLAEADRTSETPSRGMTIMPVIEYGGTGQLDPAALAVWPDGSPHYYHWGTEIGADGLRTTRYLKDGQCIDIAHPAVGDDLAKLMTELATVFGKQYPSFSGVILTHRFQAWQIGYEPDQLRRFAAAAGLQLPSRDAGKWVQEHHEAEYLQWHYQQKRLNLLKAEQALRAVRPDLRLAVMNYNPGDDNLPFGTPCYWWDKRQGDAWLVPGHVSTPDLSHVDLAKLMEDWTRPDIRVLSVGMNPPLYRHDKGILNLAPAHYPFLCGNAAYLDNFRTGEGSAVCFWWIYNEDAFMNHPALGWNCPGLHGNEPSGRYCMLDEVLAMAAADPFFMGVRIGYFNRGFPQYARAFAAAYRALPAVASKVVKACDDHEVVVRRYDTPRGIYLAVINTGLGPNGKAVALRTDVLGGNRFTDLVSGKRLDGGAFLVLNLPPVSLTALRAER